MDDHELEARMAAVDDQSNQTAERNESPDPMARFWGAFNFEMFLFGGVPPPRVDP